MNQNHNRLQSLNGQLKDTAFPDYAQKGFQEYEAEKINPESITAEIERLTVEAESGDEITGEMLLNQKIEEIPCLVEPFLQQTGLACLAGSSDTGKSSLLRQLAVSVAAGKDDFLGFKLNSTQKSCIYVTTEDLQRETAYLLNRQSGNNLQTN